MNEVKNLVAALNLKYEQLAEKVFRPSPEPSFLPKHGSTQWQTRIGKIGFPEFTGNDPEGRVYKCEKKFINEGQTCFNSFGRPSNAMV